MLPYTLLSLFALFNSMRSLLRSLVSSGGHTHYGGRLHSLFSGPFPICWRQTSPVHYRSVSTESPPTREPLSILFFGSDHFSATSLKALHDEHLSNRDLIRSIDVLTLEDRRSGRGMKTIREGSPIESYRSF